MATSLQNVSNGESQVELFCCEVAGKTVYGCFSRVFFEDGDNIDVVAEAQDDGGFYAYSVRRPLDHRLWLPFYCERGSYAHIKASRRMSMNISVAFSFLFSIFIIVMIYCDEDDYPIEMIGIAFTSVIIVSLTLYFIISSKG